MTAKRLFIKIEDKLRESLALCDIVSAAADSEGCVLDSDSVSRVMSIAISDLREILDVCTSGEVEEGRQENEQD